MRYWKKTYLQDIGFLGPDVLLFHCAYMDLLKDPEIFKAYDVKIAHNAESNTIFGFWPDMIPFIGTYGVFAAGKAFDQLRTTVCYGNFNVKIAGAHPGISVGSDTQLAVIRCL